MTEAAKYYADMAERKKLAMEDSPDLGEKQIRAEEVISELKISRMTLHNWIKREIFPAPRYMGRYRIWPESVVREWKQNRPTLEDRMRNA